jgi:hypothetical protein
MTDIARFEQPLDFEVLQQRLQTEVKEKNGTYSCTIRGVARLLGISAGSLTDNRVLANGSPHGLLQKVKHCTLEELPSSLKPIQGFDFADQKDGAKRTGSHCTDMMLPEIVVSCIIKYYAYDARLKRPQAVVLDNLFSAMGIRSFFASLLKQEESKDEQVVHPVAVKTTQPCDSDNRVAVVKEVLDVLSNCTPDYKEKALLTLLGVI